MLLPLEKRKENSLLKKFLSLLSVLVLSFSLASASLAQTPDKPAISAGLSGGIAASDTSDKANFDDVKVFHNTSFTQNPDEKSTAAGRKTKTVPNGTLPPSKTSDFFKRIHPKTHRFFAVFSSSPTATTRRGKTSSPTTAANPSPTTPSATP